MKKRTINRIICVFLTASMLFSMTGCKYRITDQSVEDEVAEALAAAQAEWQAQAEAEAAEREAAEQAAKEAEQAATIKVEVPEPDRSAMTEETLTEIAAPVSEADNTGNTESQIEDADDGILQIVFIGDSIFDFVRDETGIARIVGTELGADVYNLAIGGTSAGITRQKSTDLATWNEPNFTGVVYAMDGKVDADRLLGSYKAGEVLKTLDPSKTDYFIIEYGTNDFLSYIPTGSEHVDGYYFFYSSALRMGIYELMQTYPDAQIILCTPYYEEFYSADRTRYLGDVHSVNNGYGTLLDYIYSMAGVATEFNLPCLNMYELMGIDSYTVNKMTEDGIHPNEEARRKYAGFIIDKIRELEAE